MIISFFKMYWLKKLSAGVDFETAKALGVKTIWALSLPGKVAPITAGEFALDTIVNILREKGVL